MEIVVPGIRFSKNNYNDQKRVTNPKKAFDCGANSLVIGRSITSGNISKNFEKLIKQLSLK